MMQVKLICIQFNFSVPYRHLFIASLGPKVQASTGGIMVNHQYHEFFQEQYDADNFLFYILGSI